MKTTRRSLLLPWQCCVFLTNLLSITSSSLSSNNIIQCSWVWRGVCWCNIPIVFSIDISQWRVAIGLLSSTTNLLYIAVH